MTPWTIRKLMILIMQIALFIVFIGIVVPWPSNCGPAMNTAQCINNLKQIGLAMLAYTEAHSQFPPGTIPNGTLPLEKRPGWGATIAPDLVSGFDPPPTGLNPEAISSLAWNDPAFPDLMTRFNWLHCPGSRTKTIYVAIAGLGVDSPNLPKSDPRTGIFGDDRRVRPGDVKDGLAQTMMVVETDSTGAPWFAGGRATVRGLDPARQPYIGPARQFGGNHRGKASVLFADGSVRIVSESIDSKLFEAMSTMAGKETVPADLFDN